MDSVWYSQGSSRVPVYLAHMDGIWEGEVSAKVVGPQACSALRVLLAIMLFVDSFE